MRKVLRKISRVNSFSHKQYTFSHNSTQNYFQLLTFCKVPCIGIVLYAQPAHSHALLYARVRICCQWTNSYISRFPLHISFSEAECLYCIAFQDFWKRQTFQTFWFSIITAGNSTYITGFKHSPPKQYLNKVFNFANPKLHEDIGHVLSTKSGRVSSAVTSQIQLPSDVLDNVLFVIP